MTLVTSLESIWAEQLAKIDAIESHERELFDENRHLEHKLVTVKFEKERHEARNVESTKSVTDAKVELANAKEALNVLKGSPSTDRSAVHGAIEHRDSVQGELATTSAKLQVAKRALAVHLPILSGTPVMRAWLSLQCRNICSPTCLITFRQY